VVIIQEAMRALRNICHGQLDNIAIFLSMKGIRYIMQLLRRYTNEVDVLQWILYALASISEHDLAKVQLGHENLPAEICAIMRK
jgi:hypothetical protein